MARKTDGKKILSMTQTALFVALLSASSFVVLPVPFTPVVFSIHTLIVNLIALVMTPAASVSCVLVYIIMGLVGLPVFSGGTAGIDKLFGPTGGFYFGFLVSVIVMSLIKGKRIDFLRYALVTCFVGIPIQHVFAVAFMSFYNGGNVVASFVSVSAPFIIFDIVKAVFASALAVKLKKILEK